MAKYNLGHKDHEADCTMFCLSLIADTYWFITKRFNEVLPIDVTQ